VSEQRRACSVKCAEQDLTLRLTLYVINNMQFNFKAPINILRNILILSIVVVAFLPVFANAQGNNQVNNQTNDQGLVPCGTKTYPPGTVVQKRVMDSSGQIRTIANDISGQISNPCTFNDFIVGIKRIVNFLIVLGVAFAAIAFAWAGFLYMTAAGNSSKIEEAHSIFYKVLLGFVIMLTAWLIVNTIEKVLLKDDHKTFLQ